MTASKPTICEPGNEGSITVSISSKVKPGREADYGIESVTSTSVCRLAISRTHPSDRCGSGIVNDSVSYAQSDQTTEGWLFKD